MFHRVPQNHIISIHSRTSSFFSIVFQFQEQEALGNIQKLLEKTAPISIFSAPLFYQYFFSELNEKMVYIKAKLCINESQDLTG